jgi:hypothetical protein
VGPEGPLNLKEGRKTKEKEKYAKLYQNRTKE